MQKLKCYLPFIGNLILISISILVFTILLSYFPDISPFLMIGLGAIFYFGAYRLYANIIFKHISHFNILKSEQSISEAKRESQDLTLKDVQLVLLAHSKSFLYANLFLLPLSFIIYIALVFGTDLVGQAVEASSQITMQNPDQELNDLELLSIFLPAALSAQKYIIYSFMTPCLLAAYLATKRMFKNKKIYNQFYLCKEMIEPAS